jgi:hypothetical protein
MFAIGPLTLSLLRHLPGLSPGGMDAKNALTSSRATLGVPQATE